MSSRLCRLPSWDGPYHPR